MAASDCPDADRLRSFLHGQLDEAQHRDVAGHVAGCDSCLSLIRHLEWNDGVVQDLPPVSETVSQTQPKGTVVPPAGALHEHPPVTRLPKIPGYEIHAELGRGGMGVVYKARQISLKRLVALKMIRGLDAGNEELHRFRLEAEAIAQLQHPNIVQIHEIGEFEGQPYFSLEFVEGGSLDRRIRGQPQNLMQAARLVETLARAMAHSHQQGIVHRDLKPANILLAPSARATAFSQETADQHLSAFLPKISDFGLAKQLAVDGQQTRSGAVMGTPSYMAPEQAEGRVKALGPLTDLYALGAILYEMLTGRPPFRGASPMETLDMVRTREPVPPSQIVLSVPRDLETICLKCLQKEAHKRYASAEALAEDLRRFQAGEPILARPVGPAERLRRWSRRRPAIASLSAAIFLVTLIGIGLVTWKWLEAEHQKVQADIANRALEQQLIVEAKLRIKAQTAEKAEKKARDNADKATRAEKIARDLAEEKRKEAVAAKLETEESLRQVRFSAYANQIRLALAERNADAIPQALELLDSCPWDLRGWEWHYAKRLCQGSRLTLRHHRGSVNCVAWSADGNLLASGGDDNVVRIIWTESGHERFVLPGHSQRITSVTFSPRGDILASAGADGTVRIWDVSKGKEKLVALPRQASAVFRLAFSPDGRFLASATDFLGGGFKRPIKAPGRTRLPNGLGLASFMSQEDFKQRNGDAGKIAIWEVKTWKKVQELSGWTGAIYGLAFSKDGKRLAAGGSDKTVRIWDTSTGQRVQVLPVRQDHVTGLAFHPDGQRLAVAVGNRATLNFFPGPGELKIWDLRTTKPVVELRGHTLGVTDVSFSGDGTRLASVSDDMTLRLWDPNKGVETFVLRGHTDKIVGLAFSPNGKALASAARDGTVRLWDATRDPQELILPGTAENLRFALHPDGQKLVLGAEESPHWRIWEIATGQESVSLRSPAPLHRVVFHPSGKTLASGGEDKSVIVWEAASGKVLRRIEGHGGPVRSVAFSPGGKSLASGGTDQAVKVWDPDTGKLQHSYRGHQFEVVDLEYSFDGRFLASLSQPQPEQQKIDPRKFATEKRPQGPRGSFVIWETGQGKEVLSFPCRDNLAPAWAFHPKAPIFAFSKDNVVRIWDLDASRESRALRGHMGSVNFLAFSRDGQLLASASDDKTIKVWRPDTGLQLLTLRGHTDAVDVLAFSSDSKRLASSSSAGSGFDNTRSVVKLWDLKTGQEALTLQGQIGKAVGSLAFTPGDHRLLAGYVDLAQKSTEEYETRIWDATPGEEPLTLASKVGLVAVVTTSPDGKRLAILGGPYPISRSPFEKDAPKPGLGILRDALGQEVAVLLGHQSGIYSAAFSPDSRQLATGSDDGSIRVWDAASGKEIRHLHGKSAVASLAYRPDRQMLASAHSDGSVVIWDVAAGKESKSFRPFGARRAPAMASLQAPARPGEFAPKEENKCHYLAFSPDGKVLATAPGVFHPFLASPFSRPITIPPRKAGPRIVRDEPDEPQAEGPVQATQRRRASLDFVSAAPASFMVMTERAQKVPSEFAIVLWDTSTWKRLQTMPGHTGAVTQVCFSPDGKKLASAGVDGTIKIWDRASGEVERILRDHQDAVSCLAFTANGKVLVSGSWDQTLRIWNTATGKAIRVLRGHRERITSLALSPDGSRLFSGSLDQTMRIWENVVSSGEILGGR